MIGKPIALIASYDDGLSVHLMDADFQKTYKTNHAIVIPQSNVYIAYYNNLSTIPRDIPDGTQISIPRNAIQVPISTGTSIYNDIILQTATGVYVPSTYSPSVAIGLIYAVLVLVGLFLVGEFFVGNYTRMRIHEVTPPCVSTAGKLTEISDTVAVVEHADCSSQTIDRKTGKVIQQIADPWKPPPAPESPLESIKWIVIVVAVGLFGVMFLKMMMSSGSKSED